MIPLLLTLPMIQLYTPSSKMLLVQSMEHTLPAPPQQPRGATCNQKGFHSQNCLVCCNFNLKFVYVLSGWEGSMANASVYHHARTTSFTIPTSKYYLTHATSPPHFVASTTSFATMTPTTWETVRRNKLQQRHWQEAQSVNKGYIYGDMASGFIMANECDVMTARQNEIAHDLWQDHLDCLHNPQHAS